MTTTIEAEATHDPNAAAALAKGTALVHLDLTVTDPEVVLELRRHEGSRRDEYALRALRLGVLALRQASGMIDAEAVKHEGDRILASVRELLVGRSARLAEGLEQLFAKYLAPDGALTAKLDSLTGEDGELEKMLAVYLDGERSVLAATLDKAIGENSALMKMLSPAQKGGLTDSISKLIESALAAHKQEVERQFSLDRSDSALARLVEQVRTSNGKLELDLKEELKCVVREFSLDHEGSALARLKKELMAALQPLAESNDAFQQEVRRTLEMFTVRRDEAARTTTQGNTFEEAVGAFIQSSAEKMGDVCEDVSANPGTNGKKGDLIVVLGPESAAPEGRIVVEAKSRKDVTEKKALVECREARENRNASIAIFVFDRQKAPPMKVPLRRVGKEILVVWDADDPSTDVYLEAALSMARGLVVVERRSSSAEQANIAEIEGLIVEISRHAEGLQAIMKAGRSIKKNGTEILEKAEHIHDALVGQVELLGKHVSSLRGAKIELPS